MRNEHLSRLRMMTQDRQATWDLSPNDVAAIRYALSEIARLNAELADAKATLFRPSAIAEMIRNHDPGNLFKPAAGAEAFADGETEDEIR